MNHGEQRRSRNVARLLPRYRDNERLQVARADQAAARRRRSASSPTTRGTSFGCRPCWPPLGRRIARVSQPPPRPSPPPPLVACMCFLRLVAVVVSGGGAVFRESEALTLTIVGCRARALSLARVVSLSSAIYHWRHCGGRRAAATTAAARGARRGGPRARESTRRLTIKSRRRVCRLIVAQSCVLKARLVVDDHKTAASTICGRFSGRISMAISSSKRQSALTFKRVAFSLTTQIKTIIKFYNDEKVCNARKQNFFCKHDFILKTK